MVDILTEHPYLTGVIWPLATLFLLVLLIIFYRKKKYYERIIATLFGSEEAAFELYEEAAKLEKQDVKAHIFKP